MNQGVRLRLEHAQALLDGPALVGVWSRCTTWLIRLALEHALDDLWKHRHPGLVHCNKRAQLLALGAVVDRDVQYRAAQLWSTLSRAGHHHHYELSPTVGELRGWLGETRVLAAELAAARDHLAHRRAAR